MKQTAVEWIVDQMFKQGYFDGNKPLSITNLDHLQHKAKEMECEQMASNCSQLNKSTMIFGEHQIQMLEISDEEIEEASRQINYGGGSMGWIKDAFKKGAKWYREQLKQKQ